jgi:hypothetical protein
MHLVHAQGICIHFYNASNFFFNRFHLFSQLIDYFPLMSVCAAPTCSHQSFDGSSYYVDVDVPYQTLVIRFLNNLMTCFFSLYDLS